MFNKTKISMLSVFALTMAVSSAGYAYDLKPYVGAGYTYTDVELNHHFDAVAETDYHSAFIAAGVQPHQNWGLEMFYQASKEESKSIAGLVKNKTDFQAIGLDALGYLPVHQRVNLIGSVGLGHYRFHTDADGFVSLSETEKNLGWRFGAGVQYQLTDNLALRGMARYVMLDTDSGDVVDRMMDVSVGAYWQF